MFFNISHSKLLDTILNQSALLTNLFCITQGKLTLNLDGYKNLVKLLYCPKTHDVNELTLEQVRQLSIFGVRKKKTGDTTRNPQLWMPPESAIEKLARLVQCQIDYLETAGIPDASLPKFLKSGCLIKTADGQVEYNFGTDAYIGDVQQMIDVPIVSSHLPPMSKKRKREIGATPKKQTRKPLTSTPKKTLT